MSAAPMKTSERRARKTAFGLLVASGLVGLSIAPVQSGCATQTVTVSTRALERSGRSSFVCLGQPGKGAVLRPITDCNATTVLAIDDYTTTDVDGGPTRDLPHLYALVTQTTRGEVAVIDTSSINNYVLDQDPSVPGANFLPIGAQPVDIVSSPGGTATFVGVAEIGREGLFALPSTRIRPASADGSGGSGGGGGSTSTGSVALPEISSWPSCRLPAAPGQMLLIPDPAGKTNPDAKAATRPCCDAAYGALADDKACSASADEDGGADPGPRAVGLNGDLEAEGKGRQKLVVTIPSKGGIAVIDAQALLDTQAGAYEPCPVERWLPLSTDMPELPAKPPVGGAACVDPKSEMPEIPAVSDARPTSIAYAGGRLYASDLGTSLIHVIDLPTPCEPVEVRPLLATSLADPKRRVTTTHVAVAPSPTPDLKRYLYAVELGGSAMVFDVSDDQASQFPLQRPRPEWAPLTPSDRIVFSAPVADLLIVQRDVPEVNPATGVAPEGVRCDPDPSLTVCLPSSQTCDIATAYRTNTTTYASGAGPIKLRGTFALAALTNGRVAVVDIDDYDAPCRGPVAPSPLFGCPPGDTPDSKAPDLVTSNELSCNVVLPNTPRMGTYFSPASASGLHQAGLQAYPQLFDPAGTPMDDSSPSAPKLVATLPTAEVLASLPKVNELPLFQLSVGGTLVNIAVDSNSKVKGSPAEASLNLKSALMMNLEDPRAQLAEQNWFVAFEGPLPGFDQKLASLDLGAKSALRDSSSRFCDAGVQSGNAVQEKYPDLSKEAADRLADYVQIQTELPEPDDRYWTSKDESAVKLACTFDECRTYYGSIDVPAAGRDFRIVEAAQDHLDIEPRTPATFPNLPAKGDKPAQNWQSLTKCCFPSLVTFNVRVGDQWEVVGDQSGFLHHVIADPTTGVCRDSCDPTLSRKNGRARRVPNPSTDHKSWPTVTDSSAAKPQPLAFINPSFRFAVIDPPSSSTTGLPQSPVLGQQFRFITQGAFNPVQINLSADGTTLIQPVGMTFVPATGQLAVTDGSINGLLLLDLSSSTVSKTFF